MAAADPPHEPPRRLLLRCGGAALFGATGALASAPVGATWVQWVGFVLLLRALDGLGGKRAFLVGWVAGVAANAALFTWLAPAVQAYGGLAAPVAWLAFVAYALGTGLQYGLLGLADWGARTVWPRGRRLAFPVAFVAVEHVWPQLFHWTMGAAQAPSLRLVQVAELGGPLAIGFVLASGGAGLDALLEVARRRRRGPLTEPVPWLEIALAGAVTGGALGYGTWRLGAVRAAMDAAPKLRVALVQPNVVRGRHGAAGPQEVQTALERGARAVGERDPELTLFSESAAARNHLEVRPPVGEGATAQLDRRLRTERTWFDREVARLTRIARSPVVLGANHLRVRARAERGAAEARSEVLARRNALVHLGADGRERERYDKHLLLPLGEYLPGEEHAPWLRDLLPFAGRFTPGPGPGDAADGPESTQSFEIGAPHARAPGSGEAGSGEEGEGRLRVGPLICYEAVSSSYVRRLCRAEDPDLLANATNDVWFGRTQGPYLHRMIVRLRAVETRRPLARVTSTGLSGVVLPDGSLVGATGLFEAATRVVDVPLTRADTPFLRLGPLLGWAALASWLSVMAWGLRCAWREEPASGGLREG